ncbi:TPA: hypothetical protein DEP34_02290 [Candidatus Uhrbacteria bacterium]|nr:hypothetical protein [Candidatus Uhrbacteria bacterium]HCB19192.1 hypothetical protein [Candidatus Uhrbacteria bacterium]
MSEHHPSPDHSRLESSVPHILDMAQRALDLPPHVEARKQTLVEEVLALCKKHGFSHPKDLATSPDTSHIPLFDLQLLADLMSKLEYIVKHRELPPEEEPRELVDDREYTLEIPERHMVHEVFEKNGRFLCAFRSFRRNTDAPGNYKVFRDSGEKIMPLCKKVFESFLCACGKDTIVAWQQGDERAFVLQYIDRETPAHLQGEKDKLLIDGGKLLAVKDEDGDYPLNKRGEFIGIPGGYKNVDTVLQVGEKYFFAAQEKGESRTHVYDEQGNKVDETGGMEWIKQLAWYKGRLIMFAVNVVTGILEMDGTPVAGTEERGNLQGMSVIDDQLFFVTRRINPSENDHYLGCLEKEIPQIQVPFSSDRGVIAKTGGDVYVTDGNTVTVFYEDGEIMEGMDTLSPLHFDDDTSVHISRDVLRNKDIILVCDEQERFALRQGKKAGILPTWSAKKIHALGQIDDHRFFVIGEENGKVVKRVFDLHKL